MTVKTLATVTENDSAKTARVDFKHLTGLNAFRLHAVDDHGHNVFYSGDTEAILAFGRAIVEALVPAALAPEYPAGSRVLLKGTNHAYAGQYATVVDPGAHDGARYDVYARPDNTAYDVWFTFDEVEPTDVPKPPEVTHRFPEGLYKSNTSGAMAYIQHEDKTERYMITYIPVDPNAVISAAAVNQDMSDIVVESYSLVSPA